ncbi:MAG: histidinol dehydrogenase [Chitinophagaceae bacterium]|nr:histidinol dehydrogenase [Chitinophagaceae bacterium]
MKTFNYPDKKEWAGLLKRPTLDNRSLEEKIIPILNEVKKNGDKALLKYTAEFDKADITNIAVSESEITFALNSISTELFDAIKLAADNIVAFHKKQLQAPEKIETMPGVTCWRKSVWIEKVGLYIPGGTAPLFSTVLMLGIPAVIAGCKEIVLCTPPSSEGKIHPAIISAATYIGIKQIFKVGGVQAIAAMTYGTASIPKVYKIFGPGNQYVTTAKQLVQKDGVAIDMPAGPSEVAVFADKTARSSFVAADLLSQAEHGADSQVILVTDDELMIEKVEFELKLQLENLPRKEFAQQALNNSKIFLVNNADEAIELLNVYAPEHLILACENAESLSEKVINAGSVFIGHYSPESVGDYASGTNHTLPTNGYATAYSGVSVDSFVKKITYQQLTKEGLNNIGKTVELMAEAEGLRAHAEAVRVRMSK